MSFHDVRTQRARKQHKCDECFRDIQPGETYARHAGVWEGDFFTMKSCPQCDQLRKLALYVDDEFWESCYGGLSEWAHEIVPRELSYGFSWVFRLNVYRACELQRNKWRAADSDVVLAAALDAMLVERRRRLDIEGRRLVARIHERKRLAESSREDHHQRDG